MASDNLNGTSVYGTATAAGTGIAGEEATDATGAQIIFGPKLMQWRQPSAATATGTCRFKRSSKPGALRAEIGDKINAPKDNTPARSVEGWVHNIVSTQDTLAFKSSVRTLTLVKALLFKTHMDIL